MNKKLVFFFASALVIAGCAKQPQADLPVGGGAQDGNFSLVASSDVFTKTELHECKDIIWKTGDQLSVWEKGTQNSNVQFSLDAATAETASGLFKGTLTPAADFELYAIYPYSEAYGDDMTALSLTVPTTVSQSTDVNSIVGKTDFMLGKATSGEYDTEKSAYKMLFKHPLAFVQFHIDGRDCVYEQATIKSLTMTADVAFVGPVTVNLQDGTVTSAATGDEGKTLVINFPETAKMKDPQDAWVAINPVDLSDANCKFALEMTNGQKVTFTVNPGIMNGQSLYKFEFSDIDAKIAAGKGVATPVNLVDMNNNARANCYIIREGGYYLLPAQKVDKTKLYGDIEKPASAGYKADWLWATGTESKVYDVGFSNNGGILFWVKPNSNGNTIIALYNPEGKIVWSWHIWCSVEDPMTPHHNGRGDGWNIMSARNLGATSGKEGSVESYGLLYQWGRKDPFPGASSIGSNTPETEDVAFGSKTQAYVFNSNQSIKTFSTTGNKNTTSVGDIAYSIANPTVNIHPNGGTSGTTALLQTWLYTTPQEEALKLWNSNNQATANTDRKGKTNYDPCPSGYMVPTYTDYAWHNWWLDGLSWETNENLSGIVFSQSETNSSYYPAVGYRQTGILRDVGYSARYWTGNALVGTSSSGSTLIAYGLQYYGRSTQGNKKALYTQWALPVRCMKQ